MGVTPPGPPRVLALDAGNSKTDVAVVGLDGTLCGRARGEGFRPSAGTADGAERAVAGLAATVRAALADAGVRAAPGTAVRHVTACLAGADLPREERELSAAVAAAGWAHGSAVVNDTFAVLRAGLPDDGSVRHGVAVVCGAGINCVGRTADGRTHRFPALGRASGDWGGGIGLAEEALWHAARAADGRGEATALARALPAHFGCATTGELIEALHFGAIAADRRLELVPLVFALAADGDAVAGALVDRQADEIVAMARVSLARLSLLAEPAPVFLGGGVVAARHPRLLSRVASGLAGVASHAVPTVLDAPPVLGAALLALDAVRAPHPAHATLRSALTPDP
ncbi:ATPase [Streptomyces sp. JJ66]|uniref:N-acetylglucosamine kinase n=1 Tax=Streptomyces sp. JJ66 TaxID=2803843 RepID=UPI001C5A3000|nr:BadF/BadG/BcrA/BcrD ATPase family protein [Streptomyces sp. JJ66]MBW1601120.1 ATPase [Streptomyces sp. JJ66]